MLALSTVGAHSELLAKDLSVEIVDWNCARSSIETGHSRYDSKWYLGRESLKMRACIGSKHTPRKLWYGKYGVECPQPSKHRCPSHKNLRIEVLLLAKLDPKTRSTLRFYKLRHGSIRVILLGVWGVNRRSLNCRAYLSRGPYGPIKTVL